MKKGKITINEFYCKGCGLCVSVCPKGILVLDETRINLNGYHSSTVIDMDKCVACGSCTKMCPDAAILLEQVIEGGQ